MDGYASPSRAPPPDYGAPSYVDEELDTPTSQNPAAVRLLTSVDDSNIQGASYVPQGSFVSPSSHSTSSSPQRPARHVPPPAASAVSVSDQGEQDLPKDKDTGKGKGIESRPAQRQIEGLPNPDAELNFPSVRPSQMNHLTPPTSLPRRKSLLSGIRPAKLQKHQKPDEADAIASALPTIPEGPSRRLQQRRASSNPSTPRTEKKTVTKEGTRSMPRDSSSQEFMHSTRAARRSYQPSVMSSHSRTGSFMDDAPSMPPPGSTYVPFAGRDTSPERPWTPSTSPRRSEFRVPASTVSYEPSDLNGSPRPGTPSSRYGGSPRRPLPPAPLFSGGSARSSRTFADDATVSIPLDATNNDDDDVFGPAESDLGASRPLPTHRDSFVSQDTLSDEHAFYDDDKNYHYGPAPEGAQQRRGVRAPQMSRREVQLINGELVLECKIPTILYSFLPRRDDAEFTHMRYTAVTCDPDDFVDKGYKLRQSIGRTARETELFICVTMYNEDEIGFTRTMHAVMKNISHFCSRSRSRTWGETGWQKIVVCIISDGREKIHPRTLDALAAMGVYQDGIAKNFVNNRAVQAHVYEYTTQVSLDADLKFKGAEKGIVPCQLIFCLKEKNQRKLNSHRWFFNAFGKALNPNVCILLDVGTRPTSNSLYYLWKAFDTDSNVAGACGEIKAMKGKYGSNLLNPLVASQNFEYKLSNILDKPLESVFGYITVLPGALSAYRYHALQNDETGHGPLSQYFKGETLHGQHADVFTANMYLAEDRILCWELVAKRGERWVLKYVKGCKGETDVPGKPKTPRYRNQC